MTVVLPNFPIIELLDRLAIAEIKYERTKANQVELDWYADQASTYDLKQVANEYIQLKHIHNEIWNLESDLKSGLEHKHSLEEIGRRAIEIRNLNNQRIKLKNTMAEKLNCPVREVKKDHLSQ